MFASGSGLDGLLGRLEPQPSLRPTGGLELCRRSGAGRHIDQCESRNWTGLSCGCLPARHCGLRGSRFLENGAASGSKTVFRVPDRFAGCEPPHKKHVVEGFRVSIAFEEQENREP